MCRQVFFSVTDPSANRKKTPADKMYKTAENPSASSIRVEQEVPPGNADVSLTAKMAEAGGNRMLLVCFFGIFVCYFVYGVLQETM